MKLKKCKLLVQLLRNDSQLLKMPISSQRLTFEHMFIGPSGLEPGPETCL